MNTFLLSFCHHIDSILSPNCTHNVASNHQSISHFSDNQTFTYQPADMNLLNFSRKEVQRKRVWVYFGLLDTQQVSWRTVISVQNGVQILGWSHFQNPTVVFCSQRAPGWIWCGLLWPNSCSGIVCPEKWETEGHFAVMWQKSWSTKWAGRRWQSPRHKSLVLRAKHVHIWSNTRDCCAFTKSDTTGSMVLQSHRKKNKIKTTRTLKTLNASRNVSLSPYFILFFLEIATQLRSGTSLTAVCVLFYSQTTYQQERVKYSYLGDTLWLFTWPRIFAHPLMFINWCEVSHSKLVAAVAAPDSEQFFSGTKHFCVKVTRKAGWTKKGVTCVSVFFHKSSRRRTPNKPENDNNFCLNSTCLIYFALVILRTKHKALPHDTNCADFSSLILSDMTAVLHV